jgi:hypothetical protein
MACQRLFCAAFSELKGAVGDGVDFKQMPLTQMVPTMNSLWIFCHYKAYHFVSRFAAGASRIVELRQGVNLPPADSSVLEYHSGVSISEAEDDLDDAEGPALVPPASPCSQLSLDPGAMQLALSSPDAVDVPSPRLADFMAQRSLVAHEAASDLAARVTRALTAPGAPVDFLVDALHATTAAVVSKSNQLHGADVNFLMENIKKAKRNYGDACDALVNILEFLPK